MSAAMQIGPYEASLRSAAIERRKRFWSAPKCVARVVDRVKPRRPIAEIVLSIVEVGETVEIDGDDIQTIIHQVARKHDVSVVEIKGQRRDRKLCVARHEAMYWCHKKTGHSLPVIARHFGGRDHTTVLHGIRRHKERMEAGEG